VWSWSLPKWDLLQRISFIQYKVIYTTAVRKSYLFSKSVSESSHLQRRPQISQLSPQIWPRQSSLKCLSSGLVDALLLRPMDIQHNFISLIWSCLSDDLKHFKWLLPKNKKKKIFSISKPLHRIFFIFL
jgi:hypothetical protein